MAQPRSTEDPGGAEAAPEEVLLPRFDVSDTVAREVDADGDVAWSALLDIDLIALGRSHPLVGALGAMRALPELVVGLAKGEGLPPRPEGLSLRSMAAESPVADGDWILLSEGPREIALGLVGRFWRPVIEYERVAAADFRRVRRAGMGEDRLRAVCDPAQRRAHPTSRHHANRDDGRGGQTALSSLLDRRRRLGRPSARGGPPRRRRRDRRGLRSRVSPSRPPGSLSLHPHHRDGR